MAQYISKSALVAEIEILKLCTMDEHMNFYSEAAEGEYNALSNLESFLDTLEVKDPYEQRIQYASIEDGIKAHAETYSFNIESELFNQLTKEQQALWRKEIEQACISGGEVGVELARDTRYKEKLEVKEVEVDLEKELGIFDNAYFEFNGVMVKGTTIVEELKVIAKHFFELGMAVSNKANKGEKV